MGIKNLSQAKFKICYEYIKNNSNINFVMEVKLELSDPGVMQSKHTMFHIFHKILATGRPVSKTLINIIITWRKRWRREGIN